MLHNINWGKPERAPHSQDERCYRPCTKIMTKSGNLRVLREFNGVDYSMSLYGWCYRLCHDKPVNGIDYSASI